MSWQHVEHLIARLNRDHRSSLKAGGGAGYDASRLRGHQLHTVSCQNKVQTYKLMKISRIEGYNGKYGSNPQGIREIYDDLFEFDQIGQRINDRNWGK